MENYPYLNSIAIDGVVAASYFGRLLCGECYQLNYRDSSEEEDEEWGNCLYTTDPWDLEVLDGWEATCELCNVYLWEVKEIEDIMYTEHIRTISQIGDCCD